MTNTNSEMKLDKIEKLLDKYESQLIDLLNSIKQCELEEQKILGAFKDDVR
jgi:hypothetical protein